MLGCLTGEVRSALRLQCAHDIKASSTSSSVCRCRSFYSPSSPSVEPCSSCPKPTFVELCGGSLSHVIGFSVAINNFTIHANVRGDFSLLIHLSAMINANPNITTARVMFLDNQTPEIGSSVQYCV
jgi:hypothetical protein